MFLENNNTVGGDALSSIGEVEIFGTTWCAKTQMVRRFFDKMKIPYRFLDLENNPDAIGKLKWITGGYTGHPTVVIDGQTLVEPTIKELEMVLERYGQL